MLPRSRTLTGIVLKRSNLRESDKIVTLFTESEGKVSLIAKGVRKINSRRSGSLELFNLIRVAVVKGKGDLDLITEVQAEETYSSWRKFLGRVTLGYQLCEVVDKLTADNQAHPGVYKVLKDGLFNLATLGSDWKEISQEWFVAILEDLGYWPKNKTFSGDVYEFIEDIANQRLNSPKMIKMLK
jgi:DNA repair protein RecO (recombination protein O)